MNFKQTSQSSQVLATDKREKRVIAKIFIPKKTTILRVAEIAFENNTSM